MADELEPKDGWAEPPPAPQLETVADRLEKLERAVSTLAERASVPGVPPDGLATGYGGLVQAALSGALVPVVPPAPPPGEPVGWSRFAPVRELQLMFRMYVDPHYRLSRLCQFGVPLVVALVVLNYFVVGAVPYIGFLFERLLLIVLAIALYKLLSREAARYDAVLRYLAQVGQR
jgi:hypothetical protein